jgi:ribosomal protein L11 methyltransferase
MRKPTRMATVKLVVSTTNELAPLVSQALFNAGAQGLEERETRPSSGARAQATLVAYAETRGSLTALWKRARKALGLVLDAAKLPTAIVEVDRVERWRTEWTKHLRPVRLTPRLLLAPTSAALPVVGRYRALILYQPALAFGDGDHPTTRLASRAIEAHYRRAPGGALLDIGAGTGVLSFVAVHSGARRALGTEIDPKALHAAATNAALNGLSERTRFIHSASRVTGSFDLAVVNIELRPLLQVLAKLPAAARRVPKLLVTGFLASQVTDVTVAVKAAGFTPRARKREGDWLLLEAVASR